VAFDYAKRIGELPHEQRLHFYEVLAHNLTVAVRCVWSDERISDAGKVDQLKWINEILHRVTAKVYVLRLRTHEWTETDFADIIRDYIKLNPVIAGLVGWAVTSTYKSITGTSADETAT
jgi:hypothetical protein